MSKRQPTTMTLILMTALMLITGLCTARQLYVLSVVGAGVGDPAALAQPDYRGTPAFDAVMELDPNQVQWDPIIGPIANDPNTWRVPAGPYRRELILLDPEGDPILKPSIIATNVPGGKIVAGPTLGTWFFEGLVSPPNFWVHLLLQDDPDPAIADPNERRVFIMAKVSRATNRPPVVY